MNRKPAILILAAGASSRMRGADKLLERVDGGVLLARMAQAAVDTGARVIVALPVGNAARRAVVADLAVDVIEVADAISGMSASVRAGVSRAEGQTGLMIMPGDMPELDGQDLSRMIAAFAQNPAQIWRATSADGRPGHPVIFPATLFADLAALQGDEGARRVILAHADKLALIALPSEHALTDLDTPEAWAAWRARNPGR